MIHKNRIENFLRKNSGKSFSISQIAKILVMNWNTASKYVAVLKAEGKVWIDDRGNNKLVKAAG